MGVSITPPADRQGVTITPLLFLSLTFIPLFLFLIWFIDPHFYSWILTYLFLFSLWTFPISILIFDVYTPFLTPAVLYLYSRLLTFHFLFLRRQFPILSSFFDSLFYFILYSFILFYFIHFIHFIFFYLFIHLNYFIYSFF